MLVARPLKRAEVAGDAAGHRGWLDGVFEDGIEVEEAEEVGVCAGVEDYLIVHPSELRHRL